MNILLEEHFEIIRLLVDAKVDFLLVGGYAVIHYGYRRTTDDMDLWLKPSNDNKLKFLQALKNGGFENESISQISDFDFEKHLVFSFGAEPEKIDFITRLSGVEYEAADSNKVITVVNKVPVPFIHLNDLVLTKITTGRLKDKADIEELQRINRLK